METIVINISGFPNHSPAMLESGYIPKTSFWSDFSIADRFGVNAVKDTWNRAFSEWKGNVEYMTELTMVLNHKIWQWYERNEALAQTYNDLWMEADRYCIEHFKGDDLSYYYETTD